MVYSFGLWILSFLPSFFLSLFLSVFFFFFLKKKRGGCIPSLGLSPFCFGGAVVVSVSGLD
ncbi:hypothetical protein I7I53_04442 [Histoplasma capsulatum var. duboisii H88]|uniref:Uncharacterized protein n=1 Tax=Ajellomyces capsulatus (strain H88) TaxID=544711 RepID=A0A8A1LVW0_AJEC8|nr:hypothetical protein I7I53_04442 [Histoplasma capsulatum var. duboisii H88]